MASLESVHTARKLHIWTTLKTLPHRSNKLFPQHFYDHDVALEKNSDRNLFVGSFGKKKKNTHTSITYGFWCEKLEPCSH